EEVAGGGPGLVEAAFAVPGPQVPGEPGTEHVVAPTGVTAAAHDRSIAGSGTRVSPRTDDPRPARGTTLAAIVASPAARRPPAPGETHVRPAQHIDHLG